MALQACQVVNSGGMLPVQIDTSLIDPEWDGAPVPAGVQCWQVVSKPGGRYSIVGWLWLLPYNTGPGQPYL